MTTGNDDVLAAEAALVRELSRCMDACRTVELYCALAIDVAGAREPTRGGGVLRACGMLCEATVEALARLREPDVESIAEALHACRVACRAAASDCHRRTLDPTFAQCAAACSECVAVCDRLLVSAARAAA